MSSARDPRDRVPDRTPDPTDDRLTPYTGVEKGRGWSITRRLLVFFLVVWSAYMVFREATAAVFAPELEVLGVVVPEGRQDGSRPITLGAAVRNHGRMGGAAFVVASLRGGELVEGPTLDVPAGDSIVAPVRVRLDPGENVLSIVVFDAWRGVKRLRSYTGLSVRITPGDVDIARLDLPATVTRGDSVTLGLTWTNLGQAAERVTPEIVLRREGGGPPRPTVGDAVQLRPQEAMDHTLAVDTWNLEPGSYVVEIYVRTLDGERVGWRRHEGVLQVLPS